MAEEPSLASGPVTLAQMTAAWPAILKRLEGVSRTSWIAVTAIQPLAFDAETSVLTLGFVSQNDVAAFRGAGPGGAPDHLREAILAEVGVRVKYLTAPLPRKEQPAAGVRPRTEPAGSPRTSGPGAASPVTEWAVAPIPTGDAQMPTPSLPVDDEPAEAELADRAAAPPPVDGAVIDDEPPPYDDEPPYDPYAHPAPGISASSTGPAQPEASAPRRAPDAGRASQSSPAVVERRSAPHGVERYGEAVVRQVLGATFVREEPYEPPTRFS